MIEEIDFAVKYPFSQSAKNILADFDLNDKIVNLALERIKRAFSNEIKQKVLLNSEEKKEDIASFAASRMILGYLQNSFLTNRFAVYESKLFRYFLDKSDEETEKVSEFFQIVTKNEGKQLLVDIPTFLKFSPKDPHYKLINRRIKNNQGLLEINISEKRRLIEEALKKHIENIPLLKDPPQSIKNASEITLTYIPVTQSVKMDVTDHPPCIKKLLDSIKRHQNLPHQARWFLAVYLNGIGLSEDQITQIYSELPDFNEKITRYQVSHLKKKNYTVPSCATVLTYGLCCANCRIGHPLNWHKLSSERKKEIN